MKQYRICKCPHKDNPNDFAFLIIWKDWYTFGAWYREDDGPFVEYPFQKPYKSLDDAKLRLSQIKNGVEVVYSTSL